MGWRDDPVVGAAPRPAAQGAPPSAAPASDAPAVHSWRDDPVIQTPPVAPPQADLRPDFGLGLQQGASGFINNLAHRADQGLGMVGIDVDKANRSLGLPTTGETIAGEQGRVADAAAHGRRPSEVGRFAGGVAVNPVTYMGGPEVGLLGNMALGAAGSALASDAQTPGQFLGEAAGGAALGGIAKPVGEAVGKVAGPVLSDLQAAAMRHGGWMPSPGDMMGGFQKSVEGATKNVLPWVGKAVNQSADTWKQAANTMLPNVLRAAKFRPDGQFTAELADITANQIPKLSKAAQASIGPAWSRFQTETSPALWSQSLADLNKNLEALAGSGGKAVSRVWDTARQAALDAAERQNPRLADAIQAGRNPSSVAALARAKPPKSISLRDVGAAGMGAGGGAWGLKEALSPFQPVMHATGLDKVLPAVEAGLAAYGVGSTTIPYNKVITNALRGWANPGAVRAPVAKAVRQVAPRVAVGAAATAPSSRD